MKEWSTRRRYAAAMTVSSVSAVALYALSPFLFFVLGAAVAVVFGVRYLLKADERDAAAN